MRYRMSTRLVSSLALLGVLLMTATVEAKKPVIPPPDPQEDPCDVLAFSPDFVFWRETGRRNAPERSIFLADALTSCEKPLAVVPLGTDGWMRSLKFSFDFETGAFGRVVWIFWGPDVGGVWSQDFTVDGAEVVPSANGPRELLHFERADYYTSVDTYIYSLDLSPDMATLAYEYTQRDADGATDSLRLIRIDDVATSCGGGPCSPDAGITELLDEIDDEGNFAYPTWGPSGERVYVREIPAGLENIGRSNVLYYDIGWQNGWPPPVSGPSVLFSSQDSPDPANYVSPRWLTAGIRNGREVLAFEQEPNPYEACEDIYIVDVDACIDAGVCFNEPAFSGTHPSWTGPGHIVHEYGTWATNDGNCATKDVGIWDGGSPIPLFSGKEPDGAVGVN